MDASSSGRVHEDILPMSVSQAQHVAHHAPDCRRLSERQPGIVPAGWVCERRQEEVVQQWWIHFENLVE